MAINKHIANTTSALIAAELAMASSNSGTATRRQAEKLLDDYFYLVEESVPWVENNPLDRRS
jgi:hypothetical protein